MRLSPNAMGALVALAAFALFSTHDVIIKTLGAHYAAPQIVFFSVLFSFPLATLLLIGDRSPATLRPVHPWWTLARTVAGVVAAVCAFTAFSLLPLAQTYALLFAMPLLITAMSVPVLGERVSALRWAAVLGGLMGVLIVLRPGATDLGLGHAAGITAAVASAFVAVVMRRIGRDERPVVMLIYPMIANAAVMGAALPWVYEPMPGDHVVLFALVAALAFSATFLTVRAYALAEAAAVAPMQYSQIIWATIFGALVFGERPDAATVLGAAIIIGAGLVILFAERRGDTDVSPVTRTRTPRETGLRASTLMRQRGAGGLGVAGRSDIGTALRDDA